MFKLRLHPGGWNAVPARIVLTDDLWSAEIDGEPAGIPHHDPVHAVGVLRIWHSRKVEITESEYRFLTTTLKEWAREHYPDHPLLDPRKAVNPNTLRPIPAHTAPTAPEPTSEEPLNAPERPRPMTSAEILSWLDYENEALVKAIEHDITQLQADKGIVIDDDAELGRISANVSIANAHLRQTGKTKAIQQKPFSDANTTVLRFFQGLSGSLETAISPVQREMNAYGTRKEAARREEADRAAARARAEADRLAREAEAALRRNAPLAEARLNAASTAAKAAEKAGSFATGKAADLTRSHTDYGSTVSGQETWDFQVADISKVPLRLLQINEVEMRKEMRVYVRDHLDEARAGGSPVTGVKLIRSIAMRTR
jgi:hypothetical protein